MWLKMLNFDSKGFSENHKYYAAGADPGGAPWVQKPLNL